MSAKLSDKLQFVVVLYEHQLAVGDDDKLKFVGHAIKNRLCPRAVVATRKEVCRHVGSNRFQLACRYEE